MHVDLIKIKRQIEILGIVLNSKQPIFTFDLADMFNCDEITIKRDLCSLRENDIPIHSKRKKGVVILDPVPHSKIKELILQYLGFCLSNSTIDKATNILLKKHNHFALSNLVIIQRCIENKFKLEIDYQKTDDEIEKKIIILPILIFKADNYWRVMAKHNETYRQFIINKIKNIKATNQKFNSFPKNVIENLFKFSFRSWIGTEQYRIKIKLSHVWANRLKPNLLMESQIISENPDGSFLLEATVNSLNEIAAWIVSRGEGVTVLEPPELKEAVIKLAKDALKNYL